MGEFVPKFGNGGAIIRFRKMNAKNAASAMKMERKVANEDRSGCRSIGADICPDVCRAFATPQSALPRWAR
jgi:hypothetical protein